MNDLEKLRHSCAHVLAQAVKELYPEAKLAIGPPIEDGFYYDFDNLDITLEDLPKIEKRMSEIIKKNAKFEKIMKTKAEAKKMIKDEPYKIELLEQLDEPPSFYKDGDFIDLCRGPHVESTGKIKAFKLLSIAGAYWRGDSKNKMLTRIYGTAFPSEKELKGYLTLREEAEKRDHRKLGKQMELFSFHEEAPGFPFFLPKGEFIFSTLIDFMRLEMVKRNYVLIKAPLILNKGLWLKSGHWDHYKENMYFTKMENKDFAIKPMNCPGTILVFKEKLHSYRELPLRIAEFGVVHRHELSGVLSGLFRVRAFTQDDAHIFCSEDQLEEEVGKIIDFIDVVYKTFGFSYHIELSTRPEKAMGSKEVWDKAENALKEALKAKKADYKLNPGEGAFYGPKIDFHIKDAIGRTWQCATVQIDFSMPEKFDLSYDGKDNQKHRIVMIHRAIYGSIERFLGILIEHFAGKFPLWISLIQVRIITVADRFNKYAEEVKKELEKNDIRVDFDQRTESVSKKVRDAQLEKIPLVINVGEKEEKAKTIAVRTLDGKVKFGLKLNDFIKNIQDNVEKKKLTVDFI